MPQWRKLHTKIVESLDFQDMPDDFTRLVWVLLPLGVDREGRSLDNTNLVKARLMPLRDDVGAVDIARALDWFAERGMIQRYSVNGRGYFMIPTFAQYQGDTRKEAASVLPAPIGTVPSTVPTLYLVKSKSSADVDTDVDSDSETDVDSETDADTDTERFAASVSTPEPAPVGDYLAQGLRYFENAIGVVAGVRQSEEIRMSLDELHERGLDDWWQTAVDLAIDNNKRSWAYIRAILQNHLRDGTAPIRKAGPIHGPPKPQKRTIRILDPLTGQPQVIEAMV